jgi:hypothetical protein
MNLMNKLIMTLLATILLAPAANAEIKVTKDSMGYTHYSGDVDGKSRDDSMDYRHYDFHHDGNTIHCLEHRNGNTTILHCN